MRTRERERFIKMNFTPEELEVRDKLYKARKHAKYKIVITEERCNEKKRKHSGYNLDGYLGYYSDYPEDGTYIDTIYFRYPDEFKLVIQLYEGLFYQLFDTETGNRIGYGSLDPDSPVEEIRDNEKDGCPSICKFCFFHGMLYGEKETENNNYVCYRKGVMK